MPQLLPAVDARLDAAGLATHSATSAAETVPKTLEELEREHILRVLDQSDGRERAAATLGISLRTLYCKLREYKSRTNSAGLATEP